MTTFIRVKKIGGMTLWMQSSPQVLNNPVLHAVSRIKNSTSSGISRKRRKEIDPKILHKTCHFLGIEYNPWYEVSGISSHHIDSRTFEVSKFECNNPAVKTKDLNNLELYHGADIGISVFNQNGLASFDFWFSIKKQEEKLKG